VSDTAGLTRQQMIDALLAKVAEYRAQMGQQVDGSSQRLVEKAVIQKFERTPLPGEVLEPIETIVVENGVITVIPGKGD